MKREHTEGRISERGIALLTVILGLLMMSALTTAIILLAGRESYLMGKQRFASNAMYAAGAGLEEARGRLLFYHPNALAGAPYRVGQVLYITNPGPGETVNPANLASSNPYADTEYQKEFGAPVTSALSVTTLPGASPSATGTGQIPFKWVRVTVKTELAANADIDGNGSYDNTIPVYYDGVHQNLNYSGDQVYRLTGLAVLPNGTRQMVQADVSGRLNGFDYALAVAGDCEIEPAGSTAQITGKTQCNGPLELQGNLAINGSLQSASSISGPGSIALTGTNSQVLANSGVTAPVISTTGTPPVVKSAVGTVTPFASPATPTPAPLPPSTLPNPSAASLTAAVTQTNPPGKCVGGNVVFDLGSTVPPTVFEFTGVPYTTACGTVLDPANFPATTQFLGTGTIWFSASPGGDIKFNNNFGTPTTPIDLNIIARPKDGSMGSSEMEFAGGVNNIRGMVYVQGEVETEPAKTTTATGSKTSTACPVIPNQQFNLSGSLIAYGPNASFEISDCSNKVGLTYNPMQLYRVNPPPGFNGMLVYGVGNTAILNWRDIIN
ncbi:MAG: pilus assembly PilX N-terminal domain-containing protein [Acidobacteriia bacterium]|nr:pilus assembly PilX N-terminal domain-containing protein [Terriglobia bacterium]